jgi:prolyl 4-hydroxylase
MDLVDDFDPPYVLPDSPEIDNWERRNPGGWHKLSPSAADVARPEGHVAAAVGDLKKINQLALENRQALHAKDENGWQPIHEAVRAGRLDTVALLVRHGADINAVTNRGKGGVSPYNMAMRSFSPEHPISQYLYGMGAVNVGPEL